jgi:hypothetical protein
MVLCISLSMGGCSDDDRKADELPDGIAAKVGDTLIRESAVRAQLDITYAPRQGDAQSFGPPDYRACVATKGKPESQAQARDLRRQCAFEYKVDRAQVVNTLVRSEWLKREARRLGIDLDRIVKKAIDGINRPWARATGKKKVADDDLTIRAQIESEALLKATPVTELEIAEYGRANADVFHDSETRVVRVLQTRMKAAVVKARKELKDGASWSEVQNRYGVKPFGEHWSGTQVVKEANSPHDAFGRTMFSIAKHRLAGPIHTLNGWFLLEVDKIKPPRYRTLSPQAHGIVSHRVRELKLYGGLHKRYARRTVCAAEYRVPEAPQCI